MVEEMLLGMAAWVQGFRCFPWLGINFFLKDGLGVSPSSLQLLQNTANLPMVGKPLYGVLSDAVYIRGAHRLPYLAIGAALQAISWLAISFLSESYMTTSNLIVILLLGNLGAAICEVANDAMVVEVGKQTQPSGRLQSFVWMCGSLGGILGNFLCGMAIGRFGPRSIFFIYAVVLTIQFAITISIPEKSLNLPKEQAPAPGSSIVRRKSPRNQFMLSIDFANHSESPVQEKTSSIISTVSSQLYKLFDALRMPDINSSLCWLVASYAIVPNLVSTMFYYHTHRLELDSSVIGLSKVTGQVAMLSGSVLYSDRLKNISPRKLLFSLQAATAVCMASDIFLVEGMHRQVGLSDSTYVIAFSGLLEVLLIFKVLPFSVLIAQLCPPGCEGSLMALVMSAVSLSLILSGYLGVALATFLGISGDDFSGLPLGIAIESACALVPLFWSSWISNGKPAKEE